MRTHSLLALKIFVGGECMCVWKAEGWGGVGKRVTLSIILL